MSTYEWDETLETGDPLVDQQHRNIHELVAYLERAEGRPELLMQVLERLMEHVDCHFTTEEALMERTGFESANARDHIAEHRRLTAQARDVVLRFRSWKLSRTEPVVEFLREWLRTHVHQCDRRFIDHVRRSGVMATLPEPWASNPPQLNGWVA